MIKHFNIKVYGKVVDVDFRLYVKRVAQDLGISGFARNFTDDCVAIEAEGEEAALEQFLALCQKGNQWSGVQRVDAVEGQIKNYHGFERV